MSGTNRQDENAKIVGAVELGLMATEHLVQRKAPTRKPALRAIRQGGGADHVGAAWFQTIALLVARPGGLQLLQRRGRFRADHERLLGAACDRLVQRIGQIGHVALDLVNVGSGGTRGEVNVSSACAGMTPASSAKTVAVASRARKLDMVDHLNLVVQRIELDRSPRACLLAERLEHLIGRHVGELDGDLQRLSARRRGHEERVADGLRQLRDALIQRTRPLEGHQPLQVLGHDGNRGRNLGGRQLTQLCHLGIDMLDALPQRLLGFGIPGVATVVGTG